MTDDRQKLQEKVAHFEEELRNARKALHDYDLASTRLAEGTEIVSGGERYKVRDARLFSDGTLFYISANYLKKDGTYSNRTRHIYASEGIEILHKDKPERA